MSGEIVVSETPNWLQGLEEKRERRLKARLGHEAGAGAPCLKCEDKCPGLDLHFWRKACKICRCPKEEHDVHDDDIYGWAQFQLLGSKPNKIKTKIVLPGKKDEVELEWAPKGQKETIDKYLKTLPPESLPVKGSQAAQDRKQMLQKQIPIHDIDPALCHELNEEEVEKMEEYIAHVKKSSVGVGQIVNLSSIIKANLHNISPQEAHIIASRYSKGIPFSEIVKLQSGLAKNLEKLTINDPINIKNKPSLPSMQPSTLPNIISEQNAQNPLVASKYKDITHPWYTNSSPNKGVPQPQYAQGFKPGQTGGLPGKNLEHQAPDYSIDQKLLQGTNFDPSRTPSQFLGYHTPGYRPVHPPHSDQNELYDKVTGKPLVPEGSNTENSNNLGGQGEGLPYNKVSGSYRPGKAENTEGTQGGAPKYAQNIPGNKADQYGFENPYFNQNLHEKNPKTGKLPRYSPLKHDPQIETQDTKAPKSVKDLMYSTYDPTKGPLPEDFDENSAQNKLGDLRAPSYDPNVAFNTYKHDPSVIKYENPALSSKYDPAQPIRGVSKPGSKPGTPAKGYIDPKTGEFVRGNVPEENTKGDHFNPRDLKQEHSGSGHTKYDPKNPQSTQKPGYYDPKTGNYIMEDDVYPESHEYDPNNPRQGHFGPGHPKFDPKNPQGPRKPGYYDPKTGNYIMEDDGYPESHEYDPNNPGQVHFGPGHPKFDLKNPQGPRKSGYYDPKTGNYIMEDDDYPESHEYDPNNPRQGHFGPGHPKFDPKNPQGPRKSGYYDPKTGNYIMEDDDYPESHEYDPNNPRQGHFEPGHPKFNPKNPQGPRKSGYYDPKTGNYIMEDDGYPESHEYDPNNPRQGYFGPGHPKFDPKNPQGPRKSGYYDPKTGSYIMEGDGYPEGDNYDPNNGRPGHFGPGHPKYDHKKPKPGYYDPKTGNYIMEGGNNPEDGICDPDKGHFGPGHPKYDPTIHGKYGPGYPNYNPQNPYGSGHFDPETGKHIGGGDVENPVHRHFGPGYPNYNPEHPYGAGYFDPETGKYVGGNPKNSGQEHLGPENSNYNPDNPYGPGYIDPETGKYVSGNHKNPGQGPLESGYFDPETGKYISQGPERFGPGHPNYDSQNPYGHYDPDTGKYISGAPVHQIYDPETGKYLPVQSSESSKNQNYPGRTSVGPNRPHNIPGIDNFDPNNPNAGKGPDARFDKHRKALSQLQPGQINVPEDYLEPHMVNVGSIQDINPDIRAATTEMNPGYDNESIYSDDVEYSPDSIREILNNIKLPDCHYCKKPFEENEFAITVDRANVLFHAQCFKCAGCNQSLADNIYFYHKETDNVYCGRDYAKIKGYPRCSACDELIFTKEYCLAENSTFHLKHFCCFQCDTPLAGQDYTLEDEKPYCLPCYESSKAARCSTCENVIKPDEVGCQLNGVHFHAEDRCFRCIVCSVPLMGKKLLLRNEKLYCSHDCFNQVKM